jgi:hypothetical protein
MIIIDALVAAILGPADRVDQGCRPQDIDYWWAWRCPKTSKSNPILETFRPTGYLQVFADRQQVLSS